MSPHRTTTLRARAAILAALAASPVARAQPPLATGREAMDLARRGLAARREGRDADALAAFERSYALTPRVSVLAQAGFALQALGRWIDAERALDAAARARDPWVHRHRATLDASLVAVRSRLGWLVIDVDPPSAELAIDGVRVEHAARTRLPIGGVTVTASREGHYPAERSVEVRADQVTREAITLRPRAPAVAAPVPPVATTPPPERVVPSLDVATPPPETARHRWTGPIACVGAGAAVVGLAGGLWIGRDGALRELAASGCVEGAAAYECDARVVDVASARAAHDEATRLGHAGVAVFAVGATLAVAGGVWLLYEALTPRRARAPRSMEPVVGGARWTF